MLMRKCLAASRQNLMVFVMVGLTSVFGCKNRPEAVATYDKIPFTQSLRAEQNLTPLEIKKLQFYVSDPILLNQSISSGATEVVRGKLMMKSGKFIEEVVVNQGTPGIAVEVEDQLVRISFEEKTSMAFVSGVATDPDKYYLLLEKDETGKDAVKFAGAWYAPRENAARAHLLITKGDLSDVVNKRRILPGRRVRD